MDPNLLKIKDANMTSIKSGNFAQAIQHADNYLFYMTNGNQQQIKKEMTQFVKFLNTLVE